MFNFDMSSKGMTMLVNTIVGALGLKPEIFIPQMQQVLQWNADMIKNFDARLRAAEEAQQIIIKQNAQIMAHLGIAEETENSEVEQPLKLVNGEQNV